MPRIVIDNREIEVAQGTKVIQAAEALGIMIPRFCYHPALGAVGSCRVCAVAFLEGPVKGVQMSCMVAAADGMVVSTTDPEAVDFRRHVVEWLMMNHPHDCPVCDEGGHCLLQEMTISGGHSVRRYPGLKRTYPDQFLGPLVQQEMNRCIHCYRCARYYQEFSGYRDLGVLRIGSRTSYGRYRPGALESPFSGNLVDICPTGVFTDKPSRFKGRRWDFERAPSICIHCSLGCHTTVSARYREIVRQEARASEAVNGYFICDRGRHGFHYANLASRPRRAAVAGEAAPWPQAFQSASERLKAIEKKAGADAVAVLGSLRSSLETQAMLARLCQSKNWHPPVFFNDPSTAAKVRDALSALTPDLAVSLNQVPEADCILVVGADPVNEAPMLAMALRQAWRQGAAIGVVDPRPVAMPLPFTHLPAAPHALDGVLGRLLRDAVPREAVKGLGPDALAFYDGAAPPSGASLPADPARLAEMAKALSRSQRPLIICGTTAVSGTTPGVCGDAAALLRAAGKAAGLFYVLPAANGYGASLLLGGDRGMAGILEGIEAGRIRALMVVESDPFRFAPDPARLEKALSRLDLLVVLDHVDSAMARRAHVLLPTESVFEAGGTFVNQEGRAQRAAPAQRAGVPISQSGGGSHPPRDYETGSAGEDIRPAWLALAGLLDRPGHPDATAVREDLRAWLAETFPAFAALPSPDAFPEAGVRLHGPADPAARFRASGRGAFDPCLTGAGSLTLIPVDWTFGTEALSNRSACLNERETPPFLGMNPGDADRLHLADGDRAVLELPGGALEIPVRTQAAIAPGVLVIPRHRQLAGAPLGAEPILLDPDKVTSKAGVKKG